MPQSVDPRRRASLLALFVTFLWATSWILIKIGLKDIPALTFAGLRYFIAFLSLLAYYLYKGGLKHIHALSRRDWKGLVVLGLVMYTITQGTQFLALNYLPAITFSLLLNFSAPLVALMGIFLLKESITPLQWTGIAVFLLGIAAYFYPHWIPQGQALGLLIGVASMAATSSAAVIGRFINRSARLDPSTVTVVSMGIGSSLLLILGLAFEPWPHIDLAGWGIILWLAVVNGAFAFTLWNYTMQILSAAESSLINNTMLVQIGILAWVFLGERPDLKQIVGMAVVVVGVLLVNWKPGSQAA